MRTLAILPIKSFGDAKQRLAHQINASARRALAEAMFSDVLVALKRTDAVSDILVVTADSGAQRIAGGYGATVLDDDDEGHNIAARNGIREALMSGADRALLVPGDCPMLDPKQLAQLLDRPVPERSALVIPDRHGTGTNALLLTPPESLTPAFGPGSCQRHVEHARASDAEPEVIEVSSLALDVDTPEDLALLQQTLATSHGGAARTRGMLNQLSRSLA
ncbi:MAG TPA: 2-phospho-L-lactate guanylyltransferase [Solirubrobacteraceae bacterium]|jgi:2-phospho-L-lactate guanylyltransferase